MMPPSKDTALALFHQGRWAEADQALTACLAAAPWDAGILRALAQLRFMAQRLPEALALMERLITIDPRDAAAQNSRGAILTASGRFAEAVEAFDAALALDASLVRAHANRAVALAALHRPAESLAAADAALARDPGNPVALASRGMALLALDQPEDAVTALEQAVAIDPGDVTARIDLADALQQIGEAVRAREVLAPLLGGGPPNRRVRLIVARALTGEGRNEEALAEFRALAAEDPADWNAWIGEGNVLSLLERHVEALPAFERAAKLVPGHAMVHNNRGNALSILGRHEEALRAFDLALSCGPAQPDFHLNRGMTLIALDRHQDAADALGAAIAIGPAPLEARLYRAWMLVLLSRYGEAIDELQALLAADPDNPAARAMLLDARRETCEWQDEARYIADLPRLAVERPRSIDPLRLMRLIDSPEAILAAASTNKPVRPQPIPAIWRGERYDHRRIRIGYLSPDFQDHAVSQLAAGLFEHHDRSRFEVFGIALGAAPPASDPMRPRLLRAIEHFVPTEGMSDLAIARRIRALEIDVLVEMAGQTGGGRPSIVTYRSAPVQASYLGYPGTLGSDDVDYIIADPVVIPDAERSHYAECVAALPDCYLPADDKRAIGLVPNRAAAGLPDQGFVFAAFNGRQKIGPAIFDSWMRIVAAVPGSLLWLASVPPAVADRLRGEAEARGVAGNRLVFANHAPMPLHLGRQRWADLFLDTLPYNAHTTASDALWGGLPVLTTPGRSMHARCAASLLTALGMRELIAPDQAAFEATAIALAQDPARLAALRDKLAVQKRVSPVFDTELYCRHMEDAFAIMHDRAQRGLPPEAFAVPRRTRPAA